MSNEYSQNRDSELVVLFKNGSSDAFIELAARFVIPIRSLASSFRSLETEDLCQEGLIALMRAAQSFDENFNVKFSTYANSCIYNRFVSLLRKSGNKKAIPKDDLVSLNDDINAHFVNTTSFLNNNPEFLMLERENLNLLRNKLHDVLSEREQKIFYMYANGYRYSEISQALSVSYKSVDNAILRIKKKIKSHLS